MVKTDDIRIAEFEPSMLDQLVALFCRHDGSDPAERRRAMGLFYEHPYQRGTAIRTVALDGERVVGSMAWIRWPYVLGGRILNSYQGSASLVDASYRRRGIMGRLLEHIEVLRGERGMDFVLTIPNRPAVNIYHRLQWRNVVNLQWYVKIASPLSVLRDFTGDAVDLEAGWQPPPDTRYPGFALADAPDFREWRAHYAGRERYRTFRYGSAGGVAHFDLKINLRGRIKELIVGDIRVSGNGAVLREAIRALLRRVRSTRRFTIVSVALNEAYGYPDDRTALRELGFRRINRKIPFFVKDFEVGGELFRPEHWRLYRSDSDAY